MDTWVWILIAVVVLAVVVALVVVLGKRRREKRKRQELEDRYGGEYERALRQTGSAEATEAELRRREEQHRRLRIRPLSADEQRTLTERWRDLQRGFVDAPVEQTIAADEVLTTALRTMGYPTDDFDRQADALSVEHGQVTTPYRRAHAVAEDARAGRAGTEELRQAMLDFRAVFDDLVGDAAPAPERDDRSRAATGSTAEGRPAVDREGRVVATDTTATGDADAPRGRETPGASSRSAT